MITKNHDSLSEINSTLKKFWEIESITSKEPILSSRDQQILENTKKSLLKSSSNRYIVSFPWNENKNHLEGNYKY